MMHWPWIYWIRRLFVRPPRWVLILLGILLVAALVWFVGPLIAIAGHVPLGGVWVRLAVIAAIVLGFVARHYWKRWRAGVRNREMVSALGDAPAAPVVPAQDLAAEDVAAMEERAQKALAMMRDTRVGKNREYIYELPWYVIIGPPGAGKTTALQNSGLDFPAAQALGDGPVRGIGGTRNTEWWFTDQAVLIDTAGRYTTQDSDEAVDAQAWRGFLDLLKRHRPRQPVTGILVAISVTDLTGADESAAIVHGRAIRQRINEVHAAFGVRTPVYVLITKLDLLAGFTEFFDDMSATDREQVWGHTGAMANGVAVPLMTGFDAEFDALVERLDQRRLMRVQTEQDMQRRGLIFAFPQQFASIRAPLAQMLRTIAQDSKFESAPLVRGFYFTSGTQFGRPIDRLLGALSTRFGLPLGQGHRETARGRSYFLRDLLTRVVFPEAALAGRDLKAERRVWRIKAAAIGLAGTVALILAILWLTSYLRNADMLARLELRSGELQRAVRTLPPGTISDSDLVDVLDPLNRARALPFASTALPADRDPGFSWGVGQLSTIRPQVDGAYHNLLNRQFLPRLLLGLEDQLTALTSGQADPNADPRAQTYALLRLYLMLGRAAGAPLDRGAIAAAFDDRWSDQFPSEDQVPVRDALRRHLASLLAGPIMPPALNATLIAAARSQVASLGPGERVYAQMLNDPGLRNLPEFTLAEVPGVGSSRLFTRRSGAPLTTGVPGMFRRRVFYTSVAPAIARYATQSANESWVTGVPTASAGPMSSEAGRIKDALLTTYLADFTRRWDALIDDTIVSGERPMDERLQVAVRPPSPVKALFNAWADETDLTPPSLTKGKGSAALKVGSIFSRNIYRGLQRADQVRSAANTAPKGPPGPLDEVIEHFRWLREMSPASGPAPVDDALIALTAVGETGTALRSAAGLGDPMLQRDRTAGAMAATARLGQVAATLPPAAGALFRGFVTASTGALNRTARAGIKTAYAGELLPECRSILAQGFPFGPPGPRQVSIDDFSRLLRPGGLIDTFQKTNLAGQIDPVRWTLTPSGRALGLSGAAVRQFQAADRIRTVFFKPGDIRPNVRFVIEPIRIAGDAQTVTITVDGTPATFDRTTRRATELRWPGPVPGVTVSVQHEGAPAPSVRTWTGDWAFSQMLSEMRLRSVNRSGFVFDMVDGAASGSFRVRILNTANPFMLRDLRTFACPSNL
ncbi:type VI secretion system membrane subunit TssM [Sphingomonas montana]|uniref:type VI secretion system membrane subunit TssM n=1 Tax=Sphingomonas montana TaxID=1843236 RepID=UPI0009F8D7E9|nr:type VI secretion system membrane subunit TssM [Sphingomonas montana]